MLQFGCNTAGEANQGREMLIGPNCGSGAELMPATSATRRFVTCAAAFVLAGVAIGCTKSIGNSTAQTPQVILIADCRQDIRVEVPLNPTVGLPPQDSAYLRLRVVDITSLHVESRVNAQLLKDGVVVATALGDLHGVVQLRVRAGSYRLELTKLGYQMTWAEVSLPPGSSQSADVPIWPQPLC